MKVYFKTYSDDGGVYFKNSEGKILIRFAGKPQFLLEECLKEFGNKEGMKFYDKMTDLFLKVSERGFSPIVMYLYDNENNNGNNNKKSGERIKRVKK